VGKKCTTRTVSVADFLTLRLHGCAGPGDLSGLVFALVNPSIGRGVDSQRIATTGFGARYPAALNINPDGTDNPAGRAMNRRVEVVIEN
jgi:hypothetical protein